jgi:hypothetical protein
MSSAGMRHFKALAKKNWLVYKRNKCCAIMLLILPAVFMSIALSVMTAGSGPQVHPPETNFSERYEVSSYNTGEGVFGPKSPQQFTSDNYGLVDNGSLKAKD